MENKNEKPPLRKKITFKQKFDQLRYHPNILIRAGYWISFSIQATIVLLASFIAWILSIFFI